MGSRGNHLSVAPVARGTVRVPKVISLFEAPDFAISTTMRSDRNELPPFLRLRGKGEKILRQTALKVRHLVHRTRQHLMMRRGLDFARASEVVANVGNLNLFGGTHLVVTLRTCLQVEEKFLEPPKLRG